MAHEATYSSDKKINFLDSPVGLVLKTCTVSDEGVSADVKGNKLVQAGYIYPANDNTAKGILFEDVDVTDGPHEGSLIVAGRIIEDNLPVVVSETAKTALKSLGIVFTAVPGVVRPGLDTVE